jgi:hypothetical protein
LTGSGRTKLRRPASQCGGRNYGTIRPFCDEYRLSLCTRGHSIRRDDLDMLVFCFAERAHAEKFQQRFGGDFLDPKDRPNGRAKRVA